MENIKAFNVTDLAEIEENISDAEFPCNVKPLLIKILEELVETKERITVLEGT